MATLVIRQKALLKHKKEVEAHIKHPNEVSKPEGIEFVKPFAVPRTEK
ncbi:hypothetical protein J2I47_17325 [Fibrella sp. HMF5335]|uniref:Uncharacterized protein n=1 Tax=Fibrella rubiginis TaxID=2817060 RepID=A0A939GKA6_9BACT|nr:hypothetical protein [Fibrella rubiginis]MBO0938316.1 hypothetical protein [Fibrella rubiginis]